jgi:NAD(P)-dependent dehydrogenase (short-subunit alcohol dehydrogenase family)
MTQSRTAVVAGGGSGIGRECARQLAGLGYRLVLVGRRAEPLAESAAAIAAAGGEAQAFAGDVRDWERMAELGALLEPDGLDLLVNSAGGQFTAPAAEISANGWRAVVETNLTGAFNLARHLLPALKRRKGAIVNVVADIWRRGAPGLAHSAAARAGVVSLTRTLALEWAAFGIRVNAVSPGVTEGPAVLRYPKHADALAAVPLGRAATPAEVAEAILFLGRSAYITGDVLTVDGGLHLAGAISGV